MTLTGTRVRIHRYGIPITDYIHHCLYRYIRDHTIGWGDNVIMPLYSELHHRYLYVYILKERCDVMVCRLKSVHGGLGRRGK